VRIPIPPLTEERRKDLVRVVKKMAEDSRIAVRNIRRESIERIKEREKKKEISEDEMKRGQDRVQKETDSFIKKIDEILKTKEQEIMEV
jgi:ribosome recycling factor